MAQFLQFFVIIVGILMFKALATVQTDDRSVFISLKTLDIIFDGITIMTF